MRHNTTERSLSEQGGQTAPSIQWDVFQRLKSRVLSITDPDRRDEQRVLYISIR